MEQQVDKINEENEQVIYDTLFMSEPEFGLVYGELYQSYRLSELKEIFHRIRTGIIDGKKKYNRHLKKTRLSSLGLGNVRETQGAQKVTIATPKKEKEESVTAPIKSGVSLKEEILRLHIEEKLTKSEIKDRVDCKYQYVFQTVKKYEATKKVDS